MRTDHAAMRGCHGAAYDLGRVGLKIMKPVLFAGCLIVSLPLTSTTATAHVKWFVSCNVSDEPLPVQAMFTATFLLFLHAVPHPALSRLHSRADSARCEHLATPGSLCGAAASSRG